MIWNCLLIIWLVWLARRHWLTIRVRILTALLVLGLIEDQEEA